MRKFLIFVLLAGLLSINLISCDGDGESGKGEEEFTVFDVTVKIIELQPASPHCPEGGLVKLSLLIGASEISGLAEPIGFGKIGDATTISGLHEHSEFTLEPFNIHVSGEKPNADFPASSISFHFQEFQGVFMDDDEDGVLDTIEGVCSGKVFENEYDVVLCHNEFKGEFVGIARIPQGCVSMREFDAVNEYWDCPAEAISNLCDGEGWFCGLPAPPPLVADGYITNSCEAVNCHTIVNCDAAPDITNLIYPPLSGDVLLHDGTIGEPIYGCMGTSI